MCGMREAVGLIGNGQGPKVQTSGKCFAVVSGLREGGAVAVTVNEGATFVTGKDGEFALEQAKIVQFSAEDACLGLICKVRMED
jgi:hypothetical protein